MNDKNLENSQGENQEKSFDAYQTKRISLWNENDVSSFFKDNDLMHLKESDEFKYLNGYDLLNLNEKNYECLNLHDSNHLKKKIYEKIIEESKISLLIF